MIPSYQEFMHPFLEIAHQADGKDVRLRDVVNQLANQSGLLKFLRENNYQTAK